MTDQGQLEKRTKEFALFIHKIAIVEKEAGETQYWLEMFNDSGIGDPAQVIALLREATELVAIFTAMGRTAKRHR